MANENSNEVTQETTSAEEQTQTNEKTYTEAELQSEIDRRVSQAMATAQRKADARVREAERLASMSEQQKYEYELETREKAIAEKERELILAENKATAASILADKGISTKLTEFVVAEDAETMNHNILLLENEFKASVKTEVEKRLATTTPKKNLPTDQSYTKESFNALPLTKQAEIFNNNPELYKQLTS